MLARVSGVIVAFVVTAVAMLIFARIGINLPTIPAYIGLLLFVPFSQRAVAWLFGLRAARAQQWLIASSDGLETRVDLGVRTRVTAWPLFSRFRLKRLRRNYYRLKFRSEDIRTKAIWHFRVAHIECDADFARELGASLSRLIA